MALNASCRSLGAKPGPAPTAPRLIPKIEHFPSFFLGFLDIGLKWASPGLPG